MRRSDDGNLGRALEKQKKEGDKRRRGKGGKRAEDRNLSSCEA